MEQEDPLQRQFYAEMARVERWSVRTLRQKIQGMLYERTAISRKPEELARQELEALQEEDLMTPDLVFRDPYLVELPPKGLLEAKLHEAIRLAREQVESREGGEGIRGFEAT
jgi:predicted nuclease of restriction endonuclease-like (RecB) superfamily